MSLCSHLFNSPQFKLLQYMCLKMCKTPPNPYLNNFSIAWHKCLHWWACAFSLLQAWYSLPVSAAQMCPSPPPNASLLPSSAHGEISLDDMATSPQHQLFVARTDGFNLALFTALKQICLTQLNHADGPRTEDAPMWTERCSLGEPGDGKETASALHSFCICLPWFYLRLTVLFTG